MVTECGADCRSLLAYPIKYDGATDTARFKPRPVAAVQWKETAAFAVEAVKSHPDAKALPPDVVFSCRVVSWHASRVQPSMLDCVVSILCEVPTAATPASSSSAAAPAAACLSAWIVAQRWEVGASDEVVGETGRRKAGFGLSLCSQTPFPAHDVGVHPYTDADDGDGDAGVLNGWLNVVFASQEALQCAGKGTAASLFKGRCPLTYSTSALEIYPRVRCFASCLLLSILPYGCLMVPVRCCRRQRPLMAVHPPLPSGFPLVACSS